MDKEKVSRLAKEFGLPEEMISRLLHIGLSEELIRKICSGLNDDDDDDDDDEKEETQTTDAFYLKRWEQHVKYIHAATDRK